MYLITTEVRLIYFGTPAKLIRTIVLFRVRIKLDGLVEEAKKIQEKEEEAQKELSGKHEGMPTKEGVKRSRSRSTYQETADKVKKPKR